MDFIGFIVIGLLAGWLAGLITKGGGYGLIGDLIVGVLGASLGGWLFREFGVALGGGMAANLIVATIGAIVMILALRVLRTV